MTSYGSNFSANTIDAKDVHSSGTIFWQNFSPALSSEGGISTLSAVLEAGDDANEQPLLNVGKITLNKNASDPTVDATISNCAGLDFGSQTSSTITGSTAANDKTVCSNLDLRDASNLFPSSIDDDTISDVVKRGNDADGLQITNVGLFDCSNAQVGTAGTPGQLSVVGTLNASSGNIPYINMNSTTGQPNAKLDFTGLAEGGQTTEIEGDDSTTNGVPNRTLCTYLDLTSTTNLLPSNDRELFEWGAYIEPSNLRGVVSDNEDWKYFGDNFGPQFTDNECFAITKATTNPAHARQLIKITFNVVEYSWGSVMLGLDRANLNGTSPTGLTGKTFITKVDGKGIQTADRQKIGQCTMCFVVDNMPTDGTQIRIYPKVKTDFDDQGKISIQMGPGIDHDGPTTSLVGAVIIQGGPVPAQWRNYTGP